MLSLRSKQPSTEFIWNFPSYFLLLLLFVFISLLPSSLQSPPNTATSETYIVQIHPTSYDAHLEWLSSDDAPFVLSSDDPSHHRYEIGDAFRGYSAALTEAQIDAIRDRKEVVDVWPDGEFEVHFEEEAVEEEHDSGSENTVRLRRRAGGQDENDYEVEDGAPWNLARIAKRYLPLTGVYTLPKPAGRSVDVYLLDSGINLNHTEFEHFNIMPIPERGDTKEFSDPRISRARWGATVISGEESVAEIDELGHGTHVAGTVGGNTFGVAKEVNLVAVKILGKRKSGKWTSVLRGLAWVTQDVKKGREEGKAPRGAVINLSLGGRFYPPVNDAVRAIIGIGVHVVIAAGNFYGTDACLKTPTVVREATTVGSTGMSDHISIFTALGPCVDIFAPGERIRSAWIDSPSSARVLRGTSMSSPHVTGIIALVISTLGNLPPATMKEVVLGIATQDVVEGRLDGSANLMAYNKPKLQQGRKEIDGKGEREKSKSMWSQPQDDDEYE